MYKSKQAMIAVIATGLLLTGCGGGNAADPKPNNAAEQPVNQEEQSTNNPAEQEPDNTEVKESGGGQTGNNAADQFIKDVMSGQYDAVYERLGPEMKEAVGSPEDMETMLKDFTADVEKLDFTSELLFGGGGRYVWIDPGNTKGLTAVFDETGQAIGVQLLPLTTYAETDNRTTKQSYALPFKGEWLVFWGGKNELVNYHYAYESQRYALDLVKSENGSTFKGDPADNNSYYAFGEEVVAPADGTIIDVRSDVPDNVPGEMNDKQPEGNYIVIDHGDGEFSFTAHFKQNSIVVEAGQQVKRGELLGLCGNSGNSSEPHIHFQIADRPDGEDGTVIPVKFDGDPNVLQGQLIKGQ
ncbi:M23 family peptidase [Paenibacillaceae bacterium]|nr:M23 family peptidase [Paenibacillaceae bacterium]